VSHRPYRGRGSDFLRALDRYAGVPLLRVLSLARPKHAFPRVVRHIGALNTAAIGDTILSGAAVADVRAAYPDARLTYFAGPSNHDAARLLPAVDQVVSLPVNNPVAAFRLLRREQLDLLLDFGPWPRINALLALLSGASFTVGFRTPGQYRHYGYDIAVDHSPDLHELENHRRIARAIKVDSRRVPSIKPPSPSAQVADAMRSPYVVFHLWAGGTGKALKEWPLPRWKRLATELITMGYNLILTGAPSDRCGNESLVHELCYLKTASVSNLAGCSLKDTAACLAAAQLVVSVNTGVMHLAAALGVPLVALHGPTSAKRWGPVNSRAIVVNSPLAGCAYLNLGFELPRTPLPCMEAITFDAVREACLRALGTDTDQRLSS
jgi:ADP-heptose:LPS heptosyltransferase